MRLSCEATKSNRGARVNGTNRAGISALFPPACQRAGEEMVRARRNPVLLLAFRLGGMALRLAARAYLAGDSNAAPRTDR